MRKIYFFGVVTIAASFILLGCLSPSGRRFTDSLVQDYIRATVIRNAQNESDRRYAESERGETGGERYYKGEMNDGGLYEGTLLDNYPHGHGIYNYPGGDKYIGGFRHGKRHGRGVYSFKSGAKYDGEWENNIQNGQGKLTFPDGSKYEGNFINGKYYGKGILTLKKGKEIVGEFENDTIIRGISTFSNGSFAGEYFNYTEYFGVFRAHDGTILTGKFNTDNAAGKVNYPDGRVYEGEWNGDCEFLGVPCSGWTYERPHGFGMMIYPGGKKKIGIWSKGEFKSRKRGLSEKAKQNISRAKVDFANSSGSVKKDILDNGVFVGNEDHSFGTFTGYNGIIIRGVFSEEGKAGKIIYPDGKIYEGEWTGDCHFLEETCGGWTPERPHGFGTMTYPGGKKKTGIWWKGDFVRR